MYKTTPINRNKVLQGLQNLKFDDIENYRTNADFCILITNTKKKGKKNEYQKCN